MTVKSETTSTVLRKVIDGEGIVLDVNPDEPDCEEDDKECFATEDVINNMRYACEGENSDSDDEGDMPFERIAKKMEDISGDGGVRKMVLRAGAGKIVPEDSIVRVHYNAYLEMASVPYDSTRLRKQPQKFRLGSSEVLTGFDTAVASMRRGELSRYLVRADYALGESGCPPRVPPNSAVMMEIELLSFVEEGGVEDFFHLTNEERGRLSFDKIRKVCDSKREEGNILVESKQWGKAQVMYRKAADILELVNLKNSAEQSQQQKILLKVYLNIALCALKKKTYPHVITMCRKALEIDSRNVKAMFRKAQAFRHMSDFGKAKEWLVKARKQEPNSSEIGQEFELLAKDVQNFNFLERDICKRMFNSSKIEGNKEEPQAEKQSTPDKISNCDVSTEFRNMVDTKLREFQGDNNENVLPFPACNLTVPEITYVMQAAHDLNLDVQQRGEGYTLKLTIAKKRNK